MQNATDFTLENMTMHGFSTGMFLDGVDGITLRNNDLIDLAWDGIIGGDIHHAVFSGNVISLDIPSGRKHSDGFQFWNVGSNLPSTDMLIEDNVIQAHNNQSHGIYMANAIANNGGGAGSFFQDVVIRGNTIISGDGLGLSWGQTDHLDIHGNIVLDDPTLPADRTSPSIRVHYSATDVSITGNVTHKAPAAADANWQPHVMSGAWTVANNPIIRIGASLAEAQALLDFGTPPQNTPPSITSDGGGATAAVDIAENTTTVTTAGGVRPECRRHAQFCDFRRCGRGEVHPRQWRTRVQGRPGLRGAGRR